MASLYWIGPSGGTWDTNTYWSYTSTGTSAGVIPTASDDVYLQGSGTIVVGTSNKTMNNFSSEGCTSSAWVNTGVNIIINGNATFGPCKHTTTSSFRLRGLGGKQLKKVGTSYTDMWGASIAIDGSGAYTLMSHFYGLINTSGGFLSGVGSILYTNGFNVETQYNNVATDGYNGLTIGSGGKLYIQGGSTVTCSGIDIDTTASSGIVSSPNTRLIIYGSGGYGLIGDTRATIDTLIIKPSKDITSNIYIGYSSYSGKLYSMGNNVKRLFIDTTRQKSTPISGILFPTSGTFSPEYFRIKGVTPSQTVVRASVSGPNFSINKSTKGIMELRNVSISGCIVTGTSGTMYVSSSGNLGNITGSNTNVKFRPAPSAGKMFMGGL